jgi:hypothetical protein
MHREGMARREVLKRLGVAAGVAWTAPVLTTIQTPAGAAGVGTPNSPECEGATCASFTPCSTNVDCVCGSVAGGGGICVPGSTSCESLQLCDNLACPPGSVCTVESCCVDPVCVPLSVTAECPPLTGLRTATAERVRAGAGTFGG